MKTNGKRCPAARYRHVCGLEGARYECGGSMYAPTTRGSGPSVFFGALGVASGSRGVTADSFDYDRIRRLQRAFNDKDIQRYSRVSGRAGSRGFCCPTSVSGFRCPCMTSTPRSRKNARPNLPALLATKRSVSPSILVASMGLFDPREPKSGSPSISFGSLTSGADQGSINFLIQTSIVV